MVTFQQIEKTKRDLACYQKSLALKKLKKRKAETRYKIELGGLVIKSGLAHYDKALILGALKHALNLMNQEHHYDSIFRSIGELEFLSSV